jgi:hypothetical protein
VQHACRLAEPDVTAEVVPTVLQAIIRDEPGLAAAVAAGALARAVVHIGADTRPSSPGLVARVKAGVEAMGAVARDHGLLTTPQLHHIIRVTNMVAAGAAAATVAGVDLTPFADPATGYFRMLREGFDRAMAAGVAGVPVSPATLAARSVLFVDGAHGVGGPKVSKKAGWREWRGGGGMDAHSPPAPCGSQPQVPTLSSASTQHRAPAVLPFHAPQRMACSALYGRRHPSPDRHPLPFPATGAIATGDNLPPPPLLEVQAEELATWMEGAVRIHVRNTGRGEGDADRLNDGVGAEHAQKARLPPAGFTAAGASTSHNALRRCCNLNPGDAAAP